LPRGDRHFGSHTAPRISGDHLQQKEKNGMFLRSLVAGLALLAFSAAAHAFRAVDELTPSTSGRFPAYPAEPLPLSLFWLQGGAMVDSNLLRLTNAPPTEEVLRLGAGGRKDTYVYGRQMLRLEGRVDGYLFNRFSELDYIGYGGLAEWHWALGGDLDGVLGVSQRRYQRDFSQIQAAQRDQITETHYIANGAYRLGPSVRLSAGADAAHVKDQLFRQNELTTIGTFAQADYVTALGNRFGVQYRQAHGDAPVPELVDPTGTLVNNDFNEHAVMFVAAFVNPFLRVDGRAGRTKRTYSELPGRDFEGTTWNVAADWLVTTKTALGFETYYEPRSIIDIGATHVVVRGVSFGPGWAPTAKLNFSARVMRERQQFAGDPGTVLVPGTPQRLEIVRLTRLGAYWEYNRQIHWTFAIDHGERESNLLNRDYTYNAFIANVRYLFW
jgi:hypothetical protein